MVSFYCAHITLYLWRRERYFSSLGRFFTTLSTSSLTIPIMAWSLTNLCVTPTPHKPIAAVNANSGTSTPTHRAIIQPIKATPPIMVFLLSNPVQTFLTNSTLSILLTSIRITNLRTENLLAIQLTTRPNLPEPSLVLPTFLSAWLWRLRYQRLLLLYRL